MKKEKSFKHTPLWDNSLPMEERLAYLLAQLTLEEKLSCLGTGCPKIERLGIEAFYVGGEGAHGVQARHDQSFDKGEPQPTTVLPNPVGMCATWDTELMREAGCVVGTEARAVYSKKKKGGLCLWAPTVDMERDPRWGRTEEGYGEDPYLAGKMASAYIQGMQGSDPFYIRCAATLKHFYANNVEDGRVWKSSSIDPRNKHEYYLEPFRRAVVEGGAEAVMTAYNEINGIPCLMNAEMQSIAKDQWGLHHVVCDGGDMKQTVEFHHYFGSHTETVASALKAGLDCFTDDIEDVVAGAREAYSLGMITMEDIDRALRCHFGTLIRLGLFDGAGDNPYSDIGEEMLNTSQNQKISYQLAKESVVLLKNDPFGEEGEKLLPLNPDRCGQEAIIRQTGQKASFQPRAIRQSGKNGQILSHKNSLAVIGPLADVWYMDWYSGVPPYHVTPLEGLNHCISFHSPNAPNGSNAVTGSNAVIDSSAVTGSNALNASDALNALALPYTSGLMQIKLACGNQFLGILEDGKTIGLVPPERAEIFEITLWDNRQATLYSKSKGLFLSTEDGQDEADNYRQGIVTASKKQAFGWFVKEVFHITWDGESGPGESSACCSSFYHALRQGKKLHINAWNDAEFFVDRQGRLRVPEPEGFVEDGAPENFVKDGVSEGFVKAGEPGGLVKAGELEGFVRAGEPGGLVKAGELESFVRAGEPGGLVGTGVSESLVRAEVSEELVGDGVPEDFVEDGMSEYFSGDEHKKIIVTKRGFTYQKLPALRPVLVEDGMQAAVSLAEASDTVVLMAGAHPMINSKEEVDRQDIDLPPYQRELIQAVYQVNPKIILVLITSIPFGIAWEKEHLPAIVTMASGSMELGNALADILFGKAAPAGRLNMTWYRDVSQLPDMDDYDIIQKERTYQYYRGKPLFPFGHGLTYSPVRYTGLQIRLNSRAVLEITLQITNEGKYTTDEVVQIYVSKIGSMVKRPLRQLKAFKRVKELHPGESRMVYLEIPTTDLRYYDVIAQKMLLEPGRYDVQAGASSQDIRLRQEIILGGTKRGVRRGTDWNLADHYDRSENAILWEGHKGYTCVTNSREMERHAGDSSNAVDKEETSSIRIHDMELIYENVSLDGLPTKLLLDAEVAAESRVEAYLDHVLIGEYIGKQRERLEKIASADGMKTAVPDVEALPDKNVEKIAGTDGVETAMSDTVALPNKNVEKIAGVDGVEARHPGYGNDFQELEIPIQAMPDGGRERHMSQLAEKRQKQNIILEETKTFRLRLLCHGMVKICRWRLG